MSQLRNSTEDLVESLGSPVLSALYGVMASTGNICVFEYEKIMLRYQSFLANHNLEIYIQILFLCIC